MRIRIIMLEIARWIVFIIVLLAASLLVACSLWIMFEIMRRLLLP